MSVVHSETSHGRLVEVRAHGATRRLYVDGVLHTAFNANRPLTGAIWDHIALPALLVEGGFPREALLLGVGGGAVLRMLAAWDPDVRSDGVDLDGDLLRLAREHFGLGATDVADRVRLHETDAESFVANHAERRWDLVIDDLFDADGGVPFRPAGLGGTWWHRLAGHVRPGGALVVNFLSEGDLHSSALCQDVRFRSRFPTALHFACDAYENTVAALTTSRTSPQALRARIAAHPVVGQARWRRWRRFSVHRLWPR